MSTFDLILKQDERLAHYSSIIPSAYKLLIEEIINLNKETKIEFIQVEYDMYNNSVYEITLIVPHNTLLISSHLEARISDMGGNIYEEDEYVTIILPYKNIFGGRIFDAEILDQLGMYDWSMEPVDRRVDTNRLMRFIQEEALDDLDEIVLIELAKHTTYVSFEKLMDKMIMLVKSLPEQINLLFDTTDKLGSEHWLSVLLWPYLQEKVVKVINTYRDIDNEHPIVILDDCIYSAQHMMKTIAKISHDYNCTQDPAYCLNPTNQVTMIKGLPDLTVKNKYLTNKIIVAVPYISVTAEAIYLPMFSRSVNIDLEIVFVHKLYPFINILRELPNTKDLFESTLDLIDYMHERWETFDANIPIYFDHKIAGEHSSFPTIYKEIVKELPSRARIEELSDTIEQL